MKLSNKIRKIWHDTYYFFATDRGVKFALTCKSVAEQIDVGLSKSWMKRLRFYFHISLCQGCKNYLTLSEKLKEVVIRSISNSEDPVRLEKLNTELLKIHTQKNQPKK